MNDSTNETLWTIEDMSKYLRRSRRWIFTHLAYAGDRRGSIPHVRLAGTRTPRFIPSVIHAWVRQGCPAVDELLLEEE
jgi:hypothetical protein